jgi:hypothetical protein
MKITKSNTNVLLVIILQMKLPYYDKNWSLDMHIWIKE